MESTNLFPIPFVSQEKWHTHTHTQQPPSPPQFRPPTHTGTQIPERYPAKLWVSQWLEHAGIVESRQGEKAAAICQHQGNMLLLQGEFDADAFPGEYP